jgi:hypothetical protein
MWISAMSGSKTRFGFTGDGSEPPDSDEARAARTIIGHDAHLPLPSGFTPPKAPRSPTPLPPAQPLRTPPFGAQVMAAMPEEVTASIPGRRSPRPRQSRLARFLGRWTDSGRFESRSRMAGLSDGDLKIPHDSTGRNVILVALVAVLTFLLAFAVIKAKQHFARPEPEPPPPSLVAPQPAPSAVPPAPVPVPAPAPPPPVRPLAAPTAPSPKTAAPVRKPAPTTPAAVPPPHLKDQLLPLAP